MCRLYTIVEYTAVQFSVCLFVLNISNVYSDCTVYTPTVQCTLLLRTARTVNSVYKPEPLLYTHTYLKYVQWVCTVYTSVPSVHFYVQYMLLLRNQITSVHRRHFRMVTSPYIAITFKWMDQIFSFLFITKAEYVYIEIIDHHTWIVTGSLSIYNVKFCTLSTDDEMKGRLCIYQTLQRVMCSQWP